MVKFYTSAYTYDYPFSAVTLAYFLRYPNPYSTHVLSTDTISRSFDPVAQRLTTVRLHLKRSKLPSAVLKILPTSILGATSGGTTQSYILEKSVVDVKEGWMDTESRNLDYQGVLSVVERQEFRRPPSHAEISHFQGTEGSKFEKVSVLDKFQGHEGATRRQGNGMFTGFFAKLATPKADDISHNMSHDTPAVAVTTDPSSRTDVITTVTLHSHIGQHWSSKRKHSSSPAPVQDQEPEEPKQSIFKSWSTASIQRSIELIGLKRAKRSQPNAKEGMKVVLERMREGGIVAVLEGMRRDRERVMGMHGGHGHGGFKAGGHEDDE